MIGWHGNAPGPANHASAVGRSHGQQEGRVGTRAHDKCPVPTLAVFWKFFFQDVEDDASGQER